MAKIHSPIIPTQHIPHPVANPAGGGKKPAGNIPMKPSSNGKC
jgi:hypothetical protein